MAVSQKFIPGSDAEADEIFDFPYLRDLNAVKQLQSHGRIMFIVRGPPGSGKISLRNTIHEKYGGVICSADDYFIKTFGPTVRTPESLKKSHEFCLIKVKHECAKLSHPVIVSNTHIRKREMQPYLDLALQHAYTVIVASTLEKFEVTPEILEKSNTKGLTKCYFQNRLKQWENVYPIVTGWFLGLDDSHFLLLQLQNVFQALLEDGKFCRVTNIFDKDEMLKDYRCNETLFAVAGYSCASSNELIAYCESAKIKANVGKAFEIRIEAFIITKSDCFAVVELEDSLPNLLFAPVPIVSKPDTIKSQDKVDCLMNKMSLLSLRSECKLKTIPLKSVFSPKAKTIVLKDNKLKTLNEKKLTYIHLATKDKKKLFSASEYMSEFRHCIESCSSKLSFDLDCENGNQVLRLPNDSWIVKLSKAISVTTTFTGLFI